MPNYTPGPNIKAFAHLGKAREEVGHASRAWADERASLNARAKRAEAALAHLVHEVGMDGGPVRDSATFARALEVVVESEAQEEFSL